MGPKGGMMPLADRIDRLRQPEYTGENRCLACTAVNGMIALVLSGLVAGGGWWLGETGTLGVTAGIAVLTISVVVIYLRGYLVPGTPSLTKRYLPDPILQWFDPPDTTATTDIDPEEILREAGVIQPCQHEDDLCLTDPFRETWRARIRDLRGSEATRDELAQLLGTRPTDLTVESVDDAVLARLDGRIVGQWESSGAFAADMACASVLRSYVPRWLELDLTARSNLLSGLRAFLEDCPSCNGELELGERVVESCCRSIDVVAISCTDCGQRILEMEYPG